MPLFHEKTKPEEPCPSQAGRVCSARPGNHGNNPTPVQSENDAIGQISNERAQQSENSTNLSEEMGLTVTRAPALIIAICASFPRCSGTSFLPRALTWNPSGLSVPVPAPRSLGVSGSGLPTFPAHSSLVPLFSVLSHKVF